MNIFELPVHPDAAAYRMIPDEEMDKLKASIKARGLNHPLVTTTITSFDEDTGDKIETLVLVDGRNRREACRRAGVEPDVVDLNGKDVSLYIEDENDRRRHDTKGMQAMTYAIKNPERSGRGGKDDENESLHFHKSYLNQARTVLEHCDADMVESVKIGATTLPVAYEEAKKIRDGDTAPTDAELLAKLPSEFQDKVNHGVLTLPGAIADHKEIERIARVNREAGMESLRIGIYDFGSFFLSDERLGEAVNLMTEYREEFEAITARGAEDSLRYLEAINNNISSLIESLEDK